MGELMMPSGLELPAGLALKQEIKGTTLSVDLRYDVEEWGNRLAETPPVIRLSDGETKAGYEVMWKRIAPGHFSLSHDLEEGALVRGSAIVGEYSLPFGPFTAGSGVEWAFDPEKIRELRHLGAVTGGRELLDLAQAWKRPEVDRVSDFRIWIAIALMVCVLTDALVTRAGWPLFQREAKEGAPANVKLKMPISKGPKTDSRELQAKAADKPTQADAQSRRSRFDRAKRRR